VKVQTELTFDEAKKAALENLSVLASLAEKLHDELLLRELEQWAIVLRTLEAKVMHATTRCLSTFEIEHIDDFRKQLIILIPNLTPQLTQFYCLYNDIFGILKEKDSFGYALQTIISESKLRIDAADKLSYDVVSSAKGQMSNMLSPVALLLIHVVRAESIEYPLRRQLQDALRRFSLQSKYDVDAMCSVSSKVKKGSRWVTDVRAIRDAIAHGHFRIEMLSGDWVIEFNNNEHSYNFNKHFSREDFFEFFDYHTLLYKLQLALLMVLELLPILVTHLHKQ
jgi:hypothetical protein